MANVKEKETETNPNGEQTVSEPETEAKLDAIRRRVKAFLQSGMGRMIAIACGAIFFILLVVVVILLVRGPGKTGLENWPTGELMEGVQPPKQGSIASVQQTETTVTVYFAEFPESQLAAYLQTLGASPAGDFTYVAQKGEDRILALVYDAATEQLSLTVTTLP